MRWTLSLLVVLSLVNLAAAQSVVILSEDGKAAWYAPSKAVTAVFVDRIVRLSGDTPTTPIPPGDPDDPPPPTEDRWGLVALSEAEADKVVGDPIRDANASKLNVFYGGLGKLIQAGTVSKSQVKAAVELTFREAVGDARKAWRPWKSVTDDSWSDDATFADADEAGQGIIDIGLGAGQSSNAAIGDGRFLELFLKFLPVLLKLLELFDTAELDVMLATGASA